MSYVVFHNWFRNYFKNQAKHNTRSMPLHLCLWASVTNGFERVADAELRDKLPGYRRLGLDSFVAAAEGSSSSDEAVLGSEGDNSRSVAAPTSRAAPPHVEGKVLFVFTPATLAAGVVQLQHLHSVEHLFAAVCWGGNFPVDASLLDVLAERRVSGVGGGSSSASSESDRDPPPAVHHQRSRW